MTLGVDDLALTNSNILAALVELLPGIKITSQETANPALAVGIGLLAGWGAWQSLAAPLLAPGREVTLRANSWFTSFASAIPLPARNRLCSPQASQE